MTSTSDRTAPATPSIARVALSRIAIELKEFSRERDALVFILAFPVLLLVIFSSVFGSGDDFITLPNGGGVSAAQYYLTGMVASGVMQSSFQSMAISLAAERDIGTLKLLRGTPMPPIAFFLGKIGQVVVVTVVQLVVLLSVSRVFFGVHLPADSAHWLRLAWLVAIGAASGTALGVAFSSVLKSGRSAPTVVTPIVVVLQFISGVFFPWNNLPEWMRAVASVFPLRWMAQGMRSVFLPDAMVRIEPGQSWHLGLGALVMSAWLVVGLLLAVRTFRWVRERHR